MLFPIFSFNVADPDQGFFWIRIKAFLWIRVKAFHWIQIRAFLWIRIMILLWIQIKAFLWIRIGINTQILMTPKRPVQKKTVYISSQTSMKNF
jgi:hypothetical protein